MGDNYHRIVPVNVGSNEVNELADKVLRYLQERDIISSNKADCVLSNEDGGYLPGKNYAIAFNNSQDNLFEYGVNGFEILTGQQVFFSNWLDEIHCPNCGTDIYQSAWSNALSEWINNTGKDQVQCPQCAQANSIVEYIFEPTWAFGELGFTFWNWGDEFRDDFIKSIESLIGRKVKTVYGRY